MRVRRRATATRAGGSRGSVLALVPAGLLVLMLLAAIAVDSAVAYLGRQQLRDALSAAANDAVTAALDRGAFYQGGVIELDAALVGKEVCIAVLAQDDPALHDLRLWTYVHGDEVQVQGSAVVEGVFGGFIPGFGHHGVRASADAVVTPGPLGPSSGGEAVVPVSLLTPLHCPSATGPAG